MAGHAVYQILDWRRHYENHRSRELKNCTFVCVPNNQHNEAMLRILADPDGVAIYGIWCLLLGSASQHKNRDGWLTSDGTADGKPWTPEYIALRYRTTEALASKTLDILSSDSVGWIVARESRAEMRDDARSARESRAENAKSTERGGSARDIEGGTEKGELELEGEEGPRSCPTSTPLPEQPRLIDDFDQRVSALDERTAKIFAALVNERVVYIPKTDPPRFRPLKLSPDDLLEKATDLSVSYPLIDPARVIRRVHEWSVGNLRKASKKDNGAMRRILTWCGDDNEAAAMGEPVSGGNGIGKKIETRKAWQAAAGICCNLMLDDNLFNERIVGESADPNRIRVLRDKLGDNSSAVANRFSDPRTMESYLYREASALAELELKNG